MAALQLPPDYAAAARARRFVAETMHGWSCDEEAVADAELLVSELVTNAVLHARSDVNVTVDRDGATLRICVYDGSTARPRRRDFGPEAVTGRGLLIVERIARRWGVDDRDDGEDGKCVWFEVDARASTEDVSTAKR